MESVSFWVVNWWRVEERKRLRLFLNRCHEREVWHWVIFLMRAEG